jgi:hypothetical protein
MSRLAERTREERRVFIQEAAARLGTLPVIVEKDYWVCWLLGKVFTDPRWEESPCLQGRHILVQSVSCNQPFFGRHRSLGVARGARASGNRTR